MSRQNCEKKDQEYDIWLHWILTYKCNLGCAYCFNKSRLKNLKNTGSSRQLIKNYLLKFVTGQANVSKINTHALLKTLDRTGKIFRLELSGGGEPFLVSNIIGACAEITKKHYIGVVTNLTSEKIREFCMLIDPGRVLSIIASLHIKELERAGLISRYIDNFLLCREKRFNVTAWEVAYPQLLAQAEEYVRFFEEKGIKLNFRPFCGRYNEKLYPGDYTPQEMKVFGLDISDIKKFYQKGNICNAGYNTAVVLPNGEIHTCFRINENIGNIYTGIRLKSAMITCPLDYCDCPLNALDPYFFQKTLEKNAAKIINN